jgi:hypothetical protein
VYEKTGDLFDFVQNGFSELTNYPYLVDFLTGTTMVALDIRSMKVTRNDILLFLGIIVAVIITLTTLVFTERASSSSATQNAPTVRERTGSVATGVAKRMAVWLIPKSRVSY